MQYFLLFVGLLLGFVLGLIILFFSRARQTGTGSAEFADGAQLSQVLSSASNQLGEQLQAGKYVLERERDLVTSQVDDVRSELVRMGQLVEGLRKESAAQKAEFSSSLKHTFKVTSSLAETAQQLTQTLASSQSRGQWGERMAEDVLTSAGFVEGINFVKQRKVASGGVPDFTFNLPGGQCLNMDVKFPIDNYLCWLEASDEQKPQFEKSFKADVRQRVKEISGRGYIDAESTLSYVLLFVPNESVYGFIHQNDPDLIDFALSRNIVLCSPTTLFAVLAVVRKAVDNFLVEKQSTEILAAVEGLRLQWDKFQEPIDKMRRGLESAQNAFDDLSTKKVRLLDKQIEKLENYRQDPNLVLVPDSPEVVGLENVEPFNRLDV